MACLNVDKLKKRKKPPNDRQSLIWDVLAVRAPYEQRGFLESNFVWVLVWEVAEMV